MFPQVSEHTCSGLPKDSSKPRPEWLSSAPWNWGREKGQWQKVSGICEHECRKFSKLEWSPSGRKFQTKALVQLIKILTHTPNLSSFDWHLIVKLVHLFLRPKFPQHKNCTIVCAWQLTDKCKEHGEALMILLKRQLFASHLWPVGHSGLPVPKPFPSALKAACYSCSASKSGIGFNEFTKQMLQLPSGAAARWTMSGGRLLPWWSRQGRRLLLVILLDLQRQLIIFALSYCQHRWRWAWNAGADKSCLCLSTWYFHPKRWN